MISIRTINATLAAIALFAAEQAIAQTVIYVPRSSSGPSPAINFERFVTEVEVGTVKSAAPIPFQGKFPTFQSSSADVSYFIEPMDCVSAKRTGDGKLEVTTIFGRKLTADAPKGNLTTEFVKDAKSIDWKDVTTVEFKGRERKAPQEEPAITLTSTSGVKLSAPEFSQYSSPLRWQGNYDHGHQWTWFVPITHGDGVRAWLDVCHVETIARTPSKIEGKSESDRASYEFLLVDGRKLVAGLDCSEKVYVSLGDAWGVIPRDRIAKIEVHLDNFRPPVSHAKDVNGLGSRKGGSPYAIATLRNGKPVNFEAAKWITIPTDSYGNPSAITKGAVVPEGEEKPREIDMAQLVSVHFRGARPDELRLIGGTELRGRFDLPAGGALFGKLEESVWGYVPADQIRKVEFSTEKPSAKAGETPPSKGSAPKG